MKTLIFISLVFFTMSSTAQDSNRRNRYTHNFSYQDTVNQGSISDSSINTLSIGISQCRPGTRSVRNNTNTSKLEMKTQHLASLYLADCNPFKYKYLINAAPVSFFEEGYNPLDSIVSLTTVRHSPTNDGLDEKKEQLQKEIAALKKDRDILAKAPQKNAEPIKKAESEIAQKDTLLKTLDTLKAQQIIAVNKTAKEILNDNTLTGQSERTIVQLHDDSLSAAFRNATNALLLLNMSMRDIAEDMASYFNFLRSNDCFDHKAFWNKRDEYRYKLNRIINQQNEIVNAVNQFSFGVNDYDKTKFEEANAAFVTTRKEIRDVLSQFYSVKLGNYLLPIDVNGKNIDLLEITVQRLDYKTSIPIDKYRYQIWLKGGFKIDLSAGVFMTSLFDEEYFTKDIVSSGGDSLPRVQKQIFSKDKGHYSLGFGSMLNITYRTGSSWVRPGISAGLLFSSLQKFQALAGGSLVLGKEQRIVLHAGAAFGTVTRLDRGYEKNTGIAYDLGTEGVVPTTEKFSIGNFWGLTYNIKKAKSDKPVIE